MRNIPSFIFGLVFLLTANSAFAAELSMPLPPGAGVGDVFAVPVVVDTEGVNMNAFEGSLSFSENKLEVREVQTGDSVVSLWVDTPKAVDGGIAFSGITPGGYVGQGKLFTVVFEVKEAGSAAFALGGQAHLNDGEGTPVRLRVLAAPFVLKASSQGLTVSTAQTTDMVAPETFVLQIAQDATIFDNAWFVTFGTQDKGSGIDYYEVAERLGFKTKDYDALTWTRTQSPYKLSDQSLRSYVYVKAVDVAGNKRVAVLSPENLPWYYNSSVWVGILIVLLLIGAIIRSYVRSLNR